MPPKPSSPPSKPLSGPQKGGLVAVVGSIAAALLFSTVPKEEGTEYKAYRDIVGVWTICQGDTANVRPGMVEDKAGCQKRLEQQLIAHAAPVMACTPTLKEEGRDYQRAAAVSLAYNIGVTAYCRSTVDRMFDARNWKAGCAAFRSWVIAGGKRVQGLVNRREREVAICLKGL